MDGKELWDEALALARPCVRLSPLPSGQPPVACFRGPALPGSPLALEHLLSLDLSVLPDALQQPSLSGTLTLHSGDDAEGEPSTVAILSGTFDFASRRVASEVTRTHAHLAKPLVTLFAGEEPRRHVFVVDGQLQTLDEIT